ncbi:YbaY family lipoprotein [Sodalis sp. dw_96]|uniref:YbaY family lipoprotein n=1 Tax=Sodalis sp. dw_96 TaxID=2719794 RepID=UPI001BD3B4B0|nr:YbaY family lipoprotein [Sodalis sp. dw_96]
MKLWQTIGGVIFLATLSGCADKGHQVATPAFKTPGTADEAQAIRQPAVTGTVWIRQRLALPPDAVLTVTLSDASLSDVPSTVISQRVIRTEGKQAPFSFVLPYNPTEIQANARILLSAAITVNGRVALMTEQVKPVINNGGTKQDLVLVPAASVPLATRPMAASTVPSTSPTQVTPSSSIPAPNQL